MDKQKIGTITLVFIIVSILSFIGFASKNKGANESKQTQVKIKKTDIIFFYGNTCPHCADVEKWMKENNIEDKIMIQKKEVYENQENAKDLSNAAESCGLPTDSIGVPFIFTEGKCLVGTPDIMSYLSVKAGIASETNQ